MTDPLAAILADALHSYFEATGGCDHDPGYGDLESKCRDAAVWVAREGRADPRTVEWLAERLATVPTPTPGLGSISAWTRELAAAILAPEPSDD
jgi:hypothetical protein